MISSVIHLLASIIIYDTSDHGVIGSAYEVMTFLYFAMFICCHSKLGAFLFEYCFVLDDKDSGDNSTPEEAKPESDQTVPAAGL